MYIVVIAILSIILAFPTPPLRLLREPPEIIAAVTASVLLPFVAGLLVGRRTLRALECRPDDPAIAQSAFSRGMTLVQLLLGVGHAAVLTLTRWTPLCAGLPVVGDWPLVGGLLAALPFLISLVLVWIAVYPADRAIRQVALEAQLFRGRPVHPVWTLSEFLAFNLRHQVLFILIPMMAILGVRDLIELNQDVLARFSRHPFLPDVLLGVAACAVAVLAPLVLRWVWHVHPLPDGPLRDQLEDLCRRLRLRCGEILVWRSGGMIVNAAVMGVVAPWRYVLISDAMIEQLEDRKIEAVFGHEAGHVKRQHILFFLLFALTSGCLITALSIYQRRLDASTYQWLTLLGAAVLVFKWGVLFGYISRRFERQADLFGARTLALAGTPCAGPCALHAGPAEAARLGPLAGPICRSAAAIFSDALNDVAYLNGIPPEAPSWRHGSIASRSQTVQRYALDPAAAARFERSVIAIKAAILAAAVVSALWVTWMMRLWQIVPWDALGR